MKYKLKLLGVLTIAITLVSCSKNDELISISQIKNNDVLTFSNSQAFYSAMDKVNKMNSDDRKIWEKSNNYTSFGTSSDAFYYNTDFSQFKTIEDLKAFVLANKDYLQIYVSPNGDTYCLQQNFNNPERYLMNADKMYIVGTTAFKVFDDVCVTTDISNFEALKSTRSIAEVKSQKIFNIHGANLNTGIQKVKTNLDHYFDEFNDVGIYRLHVYFDTFNYYELTEFDAPKYRMTYFKIMNFKKGFLGIWYGAKIRTDFNYYIESYDDASHLIQQSALYAHITGTYQNIDTYYDRFPNILAIDDLAPYISDYDVTVTNVAGCKITNQNFW